MLMSNSARNPVFYGQPSDLVYLLTNNTQVDTISISKEIQPTD